VSAYNPLDKGKAGTAAIGLPTRRISTVGALEEMREMFRSNTGPCAADHQVCLLMHGGNGEGKLPTSENPLFSGKMARFHVHLILSC
jgi:hypothetical protein